MTWNAGLGHGHPRMREALAAAAQQGLLAYPTSVFPAKARAGELLAEVTPDGLTKSFLCLSGAEANENAVKMARMVTGRKKVVARTRSYHGATAGSIQATGEPRRWGSEPGGAGFVKFWGPYPFRSPFHASSVEEECERALQHLRDVVMVENPASIAAIVLETVVGTNGVLIPPDGYLAGLRAKGYEIEEPK